MDAEGHQITLVLLPGMDGSGLMFDPLLSCLPEDWKARVATYPPNVPLGYAELLPIAREAVPEAGRYVLVGESFSGPLAIRLARDADARLLGVVLCCSFVRNPIPYIGNLLRWVPWAPVRSLPSPLLEQLLFGRFRRLTMSVLLNSALTGLTPAVAARRLREVARVDVTKELAELRGRLLYLRATEDRVVPAAAGKEVLSVKPDAELRDLIAPHCLLQVSPTDAVIAIREFLHR